MEKTRDLFKKIRDTKGTFHAEIGTIMGKQWLTLFFWAPKTLQMVIAAMKLKNAPCKESYDQPRQHIKKQRRYFANKGTSSQGYSFSRGHVWM